MYAKAIVNQEPKKNETFTFTKQDIQNLALEITKNVRASLVGGKVPAEQLPSYVDDVLEGYLYNDKFYEDAEHQHEIAAEKGKIYIDLTSGTTYRWSGTLYVAVGSTFPSTADASAGDVLALDVNKEPEWKTLSGGTQLYKHEISGINIGPTTYLTMISTDNTPITSLEGLQKHFKKYGVTINAGKTSDASYPFYHYIDIVNSMGTVTSWYGVSLSHDSSITSPYIKFNTTNFGTSTTHPSDTVTEL